MSTINKTLSIIILFFLTQVVVAQNLFQNDKFTYAPTFDGEVVFLKEIPLRKNADQSFTVLKNWGKVNFGNEPLVSSIRVNPKNKTIYCQSKIDLLLPENSNGIREKVTMSYKLDAFITNNKCVIEIKNIEYNLDKDIQKSLGLTKGIFSADKIISNRAIQIQDNLTERRFNIRANTLYFFNQLADNLVVNIDL